AGNHGAHCNDGNGQADMTRRSMQPQTPLNCWRSMSTVQSTRYPVLSDNLLPITVQWERSGSQSGDGRVPRVAAGPTRLPEQGAVLRNSSARQEQSSPNS